MQRLLIVAAACTVIFAGAQAHARAPNHRRHHTAAAVIQASMSNSAPTRSPLAHRQRRQLRTGIAILDRNGAKVGLIVSVDQRLNGKPAVLVRDSGAEFKIRTSDLRLARNGDEATISLSRSQIRTRAILNSG